MNCSLLTYFLKLNDFTHVHFFACLFHSSIQLLCETLNPSTSFDVPTPKTKLNTSLSFQSDLRLRDICDDCSVCLLATPHLDWNIFFSLSSEWFGSLSSHFCSHSTRWFHVVFILLIFFIIFSIRCPFFFSIFAPFFHLLAPKFFEPKGPKCTKSFHYNLSLLLGKLIVTLYFSNFSKFTLW